MNKIRTDSKCSQLGARMTKFSPWKIIVHPISYANDDISLMMNESTEEDVIREPLHKTRTLWKMAEGLLLFAQLKNLFSELKKKNTAQKTERHVRLLGRLLKTKVADRNVKAISAVELNEYISQFIISVRTKRWHRVRANFASKFNRQLRTTLEEKGLFCQHNQLLGLWENQKSSSIQTKTAKEERKRESISPTHR